MKTALLAGTTGLIGGQLLELLLQDDHYSKVIALTRVPLHITSPKFQNIISDVNSLGQIKLPGDIDDVFCCLGTTMAKAKSREAFRCVDFEYPVTLARLSRKGGAKQFFLVSALGANKSSVIFYNKVKGETEEAVSEVGFDACHVFRPSLLLGHRSEKRNGESLATWVYKRLDFFIPIKYKAIESVKVAKAMIDFAKRDKSGNYIHESEELQKL